MVRRLVLLLTLTTLLIGGRTMAQTDPVCLESDFADSTAEYYIGVGNAYFDTGVYALAVSAYTCALDIDSNYIQAYVDRGYAYAAQFDFESALADYETAIALDEGFINAYNNRGLLYTFQGNFGLAIGDFSLVVALDGNNAVGFHNRGVVHAIEENFDFAIDDFEQAIELDPTYPDPYASLAAVYSALALQNYAQFYDVIGNDNAPLPAGTPTTVIRDVNTALTTEDFSVWLRLLTPAR